MFSIEGGRYGSEHCTHSRRKDLKKVKKTVHAALELHPRLCRVVPMCIAFVPLVTHVLLMITNGASFMCTKPLAGSKRRVWGSSFSHVQLLPTWLAHGGAALLLAAK